MGYNFFKSIYLYYSCCYVLHMLWCCYVLSFSTLFIISGPFETVDIWWEILKIALSISSYLCCIIYYSSTRRDFTFVVSLIGLLLFKIYVTFLYIHNFMTQNNTACFNFRLSPTTLETQSNMSHLGERYGGRGHIKKLRLIRPDVVLTTQNVLHRVSFKAFVCMCALMHRQKYLVKLTNT